MKICIFVFVILLVLASNCVFAGTGAKNVILFIGDGMGPEQVKAAGMYATGMPGTLCFEAFPYQSLMTTYSASYPTVTDSAAAATAMATGYKVNNGVVSLEIPGDSHELQTRLEYATLQGQATGLVTTVYISHATPAGFGAHEYSRTRYSQIINDYLYQTRPNVLFGGASYINSSMATAAGYTVVTNRTSLYALDTNSVSFVSGQFGSGYMPYESDGMGSLPHLSEMTEVALDILDNEPNGFFLMVEGGLIDIAGHANDLIRNIFETIEFSNAVRVALSWGEGREDTLILVTADHETGGLVVIQNNGKGVLPSHYWTTTSHTSKQVPVYGWGFNAQMAGYVLDNTDISPATTIGYPDYDSDNDTDFEDLAFFAWRWGLSNCLPPDYCAGADMDMSGQVDYKDLENLLNHWLITIEE